MIAADPGLVTIGVLGSASVAAAITAIITGRFQRPKIQGDAAKSATEAATAVISMMRAQLDAMATEVAGLHRQLNEVRDSLQSERTQVQQLERYVRRLLDLLRSHNINPPPDDDRPDTARTRKDDHAS